MKIFNNMLSITPILTLFVLLTAFTDKEKLDQKEEGAIKWLNIEEAQALSKDEPRKIFIDVYTDWCGWCKKMDKTTFADKQVAEYVNANFYAVKLKADSDSKVTFHGKEYAQSELARAFRVSGYPTIIFFDETFSRFQPVSGFRQADEFKKMLMQFNGDEAGK